MTSAVILRQIELILLIIPHINGDFCIGRCPFCSCKRNCTFTGSASVIKVMKECMEPGQRIWYRSVGLLYFSDIGNIQNHFSRAGDAQIAADRQIAVHVDIAGGLHGKIACRIEEALLLVAVVHIYMTVFRCRCFNGNTAGRSGCTGGIAEAAAEIRHSCC